MHDLNNIPSDDRQRAFMAQLAYERNYERYERKYLPHQQYRARIPWDERQTEYARRYGVSRDHMKDSWREVKNEMKRSPVVYEGLGDYAERSINGIPYKGDLVYQQRETVELKRTIKRL